MIGADPAGTVCFSLSATTKFDMTKQQPGPPMILGNMREQPLRFLRSVGTPFCALTMMFSGSAYGAPAVVHDCEGLDSIANLVEPVRGFANNTIRIAHIDTEEPAAAPEHLLIFVAVEPMGEECFAVSAALPELGSVSGYSSIDFAKAQASYDAQKRSSVGRSSECVRSARGNYQASGRHKGSRQSKER